MGSVMTDRRNIRVWIALGFLAVLCANVLAIATTNLAFPVMGAVSDFARAVRAHDQPLTPYYNAVVIPVTTAFILFYIWPIITHFRYQAGQSPSPMVQSRVVSAPLVVAGMGFVPWLVGCLVFPALTIHHFGRWSPELASQQVLSPLINGFLAATTSYLLLDWLFRVRVVPRVFPSGGITNVPGTIALGVRARFFVFLLAVAFIPMFTMLGLVRATAVRVAGGDTPVPALQALARASDFTFLIYTGLGIALTLLLARTLTRPLGDMAAALRRVQAGDLEARVRVGASDEVGALEDGVNQMVAALREKERILQTFGRVVEPSIRDHLLAGDLRLGGELRDASILFCDLRGFTTLAERNPPADVVATLNEFFGVMTGWVRECDGFVDKFIGDAMLVVFGLFAEETGDGGASDALRCALGMRGRLAELNSRRAAAGRPALAITVAAHTGEVVAGRIGAEDRHEYTVIGDTVNVAARLQQLCKERGCDLLVSEVTYERARAHGCSATVTMRDSVSLRGRAEPVRVFGLA
jgi:adenylate cyclase